jgi:uncharacterized protein (UPF0332 family)
MSVEDVMEKAERYVSSARLLHDDGDNISAVSRAYYAMFFMARVLLKEKDVEPKTHAGIVNQFGLHMVKNGPVEARYGSLFRQVQQLREMGEYAESMHEISASEAAEIIAAAGNFVERMREELLS